MASKGVRREMKVALQFSRATKKKLSLAELLLNCCGDDPAELAHAEELLRLSRKLERGIATFCARSLAKARGETPPAEDGGAHA